MLTEDFCTYLEYQISRALQQADDDINSYWCDGILLPNTRDEEAGKQVFQTGRIITTAIIPKGQYEEKEYRYQLTIKLGKASLLRYLNNKRLEDCVPSEESAEWIKLDTINKTMEVELL